MKKLLFIVTLLSICACGKKTNSVEHQKLKAELAEYSTLKATEAETKKFMKDYIGAVNSPDWKTKTLKYLQPNTEEFLEEHSAFRKSFPNYKATIKYLKVDGNEGIVWLNVTANFAAPFVLENDSDYRDDILKGIKAENQLLSWDETWYFDVVDGRFGNKYDFLKDNHTVLKGLKVNESHQE